MNNQYDLEGMLCCSPAAGGLKKPPTQYAVRFAEWLNDAGKKFSAIGFRDASNGKTPMPDGVFSEWAKNNFPDDAEMTAICADFVRNCYHNGLAEGRAIA